MNDSKTKQQIVEKIKGATNILVTVSNDPSVDELSAALGLTLLFNKLDKHATAVFSGAIPPAINFLEPDKTFENTADSLRDFIIALDKEKADHLRYKLEGDVVKIFITPYRTTITSDDLEFSQGDYNVELVIALGVDNQDHLDAALAAHGKILHDATVVTVSAGTQSSQLGSVDWRDENASSLSEMLVTLCDALRLEKGVLDASVSTAFLTGIVAATERFSNNKTSSRVMSVAAQLMSAGADQQLIAAQLEEAESEGGYSASTSGANDRGELSLSENQPTKLKKTEEEPAKKSNAGELSIRHDYKGTLDEVAEEVKEDQQAEAAQTAQSALEEQMKSAASDASVKQQLRGAVSWRPGQEGQEEPLLGGTLNATTDQAETDKRRELERDRNKTILTHNYIGAHGDKPTYDAPINSANQNEDGNPIDIFTNPTESSTTSTALVDTAPTAKAAPIQPPAELPPVMAAPNQPASTPSSPYVPPVQPLAPQPVAPPQAPPPAPMPPQPAPQLQPEPQPVTLPPVDQSPIPQPDYEMTPAPTLPTPEPEVSSEPEPTLAELDAQLRSSSHDEARQAVEAAFSEETPQAPPAPTEPQTSGLPTPPPLPDFSVMPPPPGLRPETQDQPERLGDIFSPETPPTPPQPPTGQPNDPGQFRIPGQS